MQQSKKVIKKAVRKVTTETSKAEEPKLKKEKTGVELDKDFLHLIARDQYIIALVKDNRNKAPRTIPPANFDRDCQIMKGRAKELLEILANYGFLKIEDLKVPEGVPVHAIDVGSDGIPRWIKEKYFKQLDE